MNKYLIYLLIPCFLLGCAKSTKTIKDEAALVDSLKVEYAMIQDSLDYNWKVMIEEDDQKLADMKRLLDEITFTNSYDKGKVDELYQRIEQTKEMRYNRETMENSDLIDQYDFAINSLITEIVSLAKSHPEYENRPLMETLVNDIRTADENVLFMRMDYDDFVKEYNYFIKENKKYLNKIDSTAEFKSKPLFELTQ